MPLPGFIRLSTKLFSLAFLFVCAFRAAGQPVDPSTSLPDRHFPFLQEALDCALKQSPQMLSRGIEIARADANRLVADSIRLPSLSSNSRYVQTSLSTTGTATTTSSGLLYSVSFSQPLFRWGDIKNNVELGKLSQLIAQKSYAEGYRDLATLIRAQAIQIVLKKRGLQYRRFVLENAERAYSAASDKMKTGNISPGEYTSLEISVEENRIALQREELEYAQQKRVFARITGLKDVAEDKIPVELPKPELSEGQALRLASHFEQNDGARNTPTALNNQYQIRQNELRYKLQSTRLLPKFDFIAGLSQQNVTNFAAGNSAVRQTATNERAAGISVNWNIFDGFATTGYKRSALADKRAAEQQLKTYYQMLDEQTKNLVSIFDLCSRSLALAERRLEMGRGSLAYAEEEAKQGRLSQEQLNRVKADIMAGEIGTLVARADVYARWSDLVALLWVDPALQRLPASYLNHGK